MNSFNISKKVHGQHLLRRMGWKKIMFWLAWFCRPKHGRKCPDASANISVFVATNTVGKCPDGLKMTSGFTLTNVET